MKRLVVLVLCLYIVVTTISFPVKNGEVDGLITDDNTKDNNSSCVDECKSDTCYKSCQRSGCCLMNYQGGCCNQCRQRCNYNEERTTNTSPKVIIQSPTVRKSKVASTKVEDSADLAANTKNTADVKTNVLIANKIINENAVHIPIEVNEKNVNEFVIEMAPPSTGGKVVEKEKTETETETETEIESEEDNNCCVSSSCCSGISNNCCQQNPCSNCQQQSGCSQNCNYPQFPQISYNSPCQLVYFNGQTITICPNELAIQQHLTMMKQPRGNGFPEKMPGVNTKGCNACLYCDGVYNPSVCMKKVQCTDICRDYLLDSKTVSPVKCTESTDGEYTCKRVY